MFGNKITKNSFYSALAKGKHFLGNTYHHTKNILSDFDSGVKVAKHLYGALVPLLENYGVHKHIGGHVMKAVKGYDDIRNNVIHHHDHAIENVNNVLGNIKKDNYLRNLF